jgi:hypothetical protein
MNELFQCETCKKCFDYKSHLDRHKKRVKRCEYNEMTDEKEFKCDQCNHIFSCKRNLTRHVNRNQCSFKKTHISSIINSAVNIALEKHKKDFETIVKDNPLSSTVINQNIIQFVLPGQETIGHITDTQFLEALDMDDFQEVLCELMRMTYFNPDAPENNHWCVAFLNGKFGVLQYNPKTERIERTSTEKSIVLHFDNLFYSLGEKMDYFMNELTLTDNQVRNINIFYKYLGTIEPNPEEFNEIKMMAYNNRSVPIELWKSMGIEGEHKKIKL